MLDVIKPVSERISKTFSSNGVPCKPRSYEYDYDDELRLGVSGPPRKHSARVWISVTGSANLTSCVGCGFCHQEVDVCNREIKLGSDRPNSNLLYPPACQSLPTCLDLRRLAESE